MKSNATELNNILAAFERIVLVYPQIHFTFHNNGTEMLNLRQGSTRQRIIEVFGKRLNQDLLPLQVETSICKITGFIGKPESARKKSAHQYFFVNQRYMKHPYFHKAVMMAFERLVPQGEQVPYFIYFEVNPEDIDVNIHPTKTEIKFENEQTIWQILTAAVKDTLGRFNDIPSIDFDTEGKPEIPVFDSNNLFSSSPDLHVNLQYNPFKQSAANVQGDIRQPKIPDNWEQLYGGAIEEEPPSDNIESNLFSTTGTTQDGTNNMEEKSPAHYQYKGRFIMTAVKSGLMIIDQYRAHVRILYEKYMTQMTNRNGSTQKTLFPELVSFSPSECVSLQAIMPELALLGFDLQSLGGGSYSLNGVPADLEGIDMVRLLHDMVDRKSVV